MKKGLDFAPLLRPYNYRRRIYEPDAPIMNYGAVKRNRIIDQKNEQEDSERNKKIVDTEVSRLMKLASEKENLLG